MAALLREAGFEVVEQVGQRESVDARLWNRTDALRPAALSALVHARIPDRPGMAVSGN
jgi:hypothetical protein